MATHAPVWKSETTVASASSRCVTVGLIGVEAMQWMAAAV